MTDTALAVYFAKGRRFGGIKIGVSRNLTRRMGRLAVNFSEQIELLWAFTPMWIGSEVERRLHALFFRDRISGEWFRPSTDLLAFIDDRVVYPLDWPNEKALPDVPKQKGGKR